MKVFEFSKEGCIESLARYFAIGIMLVVIGLISHWSGVSKEYLLLCLILFMVIKK